MRYCCLALAPTQLVAYPLSLLGVSIRAMQTALQGLREGRVPPPAALGSFGDIQAAVGFPVGSLLCVVSC